eukprot:gene2743-5406_t
MSSDIAQDLEPGRLLEFERDESATTTSDSNSEDHPAIFENPIREPSPVQYDGIESSRPRRDSLVMVRRSKRNPDMGLLNRRDVKQLLRKIRRNHSDTVVLKLKDHITIEISPAVMDKIIKALKSNRVCQALYIQNFSRAIGDDQITALVEVLKTKFIWCVNIGENYEVSTRSWEYFCNSLPMTNVTHLYVSEHTIKLKLKNLMRTHIRQNRKKHDKHSSLKNIRVIQRCTNMWWNPINSIKHELEIMSIRKEILEEKSKSKSSSGSSTPSSTSSSSSSCNKNQNIIYDNENEIDEEDANNNELENESNTATGSATGTDLKWKFSCVCKEICSYYENPKYHPIGRMFQCTKCLIWSHVECVLGDVSQEYLEELPEVLCHKCRCRVRRQRLRELSSLDMIWEDGQIKTIGSTLDEDNNNDCMTLNSTSDDSTTTSSSSSSSLPMASSPSSMSMSMSMPPLAMLAQVAMKKEQEIQIEVKGNQTEIEEGIVVLSMAMTTSESEPESQPATLPMDIYDINNNDNKDIDNNIIIKYEECSPLFPSTTSSSPCSISSATATTCNDNMMTSLQCDVTNDLLSLPIMIPMQIIPKYEANTSNTNTEHGVTAISTSNSTNTTMGTSTTTTITNISQYELLDDMEHRNKITIMNGHSSRKDISQQQSQLLLPTDDVQVVEEEVNNNIKEDMKMTAIENIIEEDVAVDVDPLLWSQSQSYPSHMDEVAVAVATSMSMSMSMSTGTVPSTTSTTTATRPLLYLQALHTLSPIVCMGAHNAHFSGMSTSTGIGSGPGIGTQSCIGGGSSSIVDNTNTSNNNTTCGKIYSMDTSAKNFDRIFNNNNMNINNNNTINSNNNNSNSSYTSHTAVNNMPMNSNGLMSNPHQFINDSNPYQTMTMNNDTNRIISSLSSSTSTQIPLSSSSSYHLSNQGPRISLNPFQNDKTSSGSSCTSNNVFIKDFKKDEDLLQHQIQHQQQSMNHHLSNPSQIITGANTGGVGVALPASSLSSSSSSVSSLNTNTNIGIIAPSTSLPLSSGAVVNIKEENRKRKKNAMESLSSPSLSTSTSITTENYGMCMNNDIVPETHKKKSKKSPSPKGKSLSLHHPVSSTELYMTTSSSIAVETQIQTQIVETDIPSSTTSATATVIHRNEHQLQHQQEPFSVPYHSTSTSDSSTRLMMSTDESSYHHHNNNIDYSDNVLFNTPLPMTMNVTDTTSTTMESVINSSIDNVPIDVPMTTTTSTIPINHTESKPKGFKFEIVSDMQEIHNLPIENNNISTMSTTTTTLSTSIPTSTSTSMPTIDKPHKPRPKKRKHLCVNAPVIVVSTNQKGVITDERPGGWKYVTFIYDDDLNGTIPKKPRKKSERGKHFRPSELAEIIDGVPDLSACIAAASSTSTSTSQGNTNTTSKKSSTNRNSVKVKDKTTAAASAATTTTMTTTASDASYFDNNNSSIDFPSEFMLSHTVNGCDDMLLYNHHDDNDIRLQRQMMMTSNLDKEEHNSTFLSNFNEYNHLGLGLGLGLGIVVSEDIDDFNSTFRNLPNSINDDAWPLDSLDIFDGLDESCTLNASILNSDDLRGDV